MEVSFFLQGKDPQGNSYVYADIRWGRDSYAPGGVEARLRTGCGVKVNPAAWLDGSIDKKQDKEAGKKTLEIRKVETAALAVGQHYELLQEPLLPEVLQELLRAKLGKKKATAKVPAKQDWNYWFEKAANDNQWNPEYKKSKVTWVNKLLKYDPKGSPEAITPEYVNDFIKWVHSQKKERSAKKVTDLKDSYVETSLPLLKALRKAAGLSADFIKVKGSKNEDPIEPHTWEEVSAIWNLDLAGLTMKRDGQSKYVKDNAMELVRDRYVFVCLQGPRFSDTILLETVNITKQEIEGRAVDVLRYRQKKSKGWATVAVHPIAMQIIEKYSGDLSQLFPSITIAAANDYIKRIGKAAGLTRKVQKVYYSNRKRKVQTFELWEVMTTHFARATWATNLLEAGMDITQVMKAGGWSSLDTVMKYARVRQKSLHQATIAAWDKFKI